MILIVITVLKIPTKLFLQKNQPTKTQTQTQKQTATWIAITSITTAAA